MTDLDDDPILALVSVDMFCLDIFLIVIYFVANGI